MAMVSVISKVTAVGGTSYFIKVLVIVSRMEKRTYTALGTEVIDGVGELVNIIAGNAKKDLLELYEENRVRRGDESGRWAWNGRSELREEYANEGLGCSDRRRLPRCRRRRRGLPRRRAPQARESAQARPAQPAR